MHRLSLNQFFWKVHLLERAYADYQPVMAPQYHSTTLLLKVNSRTTCFLPGNQWYKTIFIREHLTRT